MGRRAQACEPRFVSNLVSDPEQTLHKHACGNTCAGCAGEGEAPGSLRSLEMTTFRFHSCCIVHRRTLASEGMKQPAWLCSNALFPNHPLQGPFSLRLSKQRRFSL